MAHRAYQNITHRDQSLKRDKSEMKESNQTEAPA
jgi:hypothetical protein